MEILEAYDLTRCPWSAAPLAGCDPKTITHYVSVRDGGGDPYAVVRRARLIDPFLAKVEELVDRSEGKVRADKVHERIVVMGFPDRWRSHTVLVRADGAGYSHALINGLARQGLEFSVGFPVTDAVGAAISKMPAWAWQVACNADGDLREHADVVEITDVLDLSRWATSCAGMRVIVHRELPHPGATLNAFEIRDGYRYQAFTTNTRRGRLAFLEARHREHARVEDRIRTGKDTGMGRMPSRHEQINTVWLELALIAADLLALAQSVLLVDEPDLHRAEPKTLRYRLLHTAARITRGQRKVFLRLAEHWLWALALASQSIPTPAGHPAPGLTDQHHHRPHTLSRTDAPDPDRR
jgi:hypothetical protein